MPLPKSKTGKQKLAYPTMIAGLLLVLIGITVPLTMGVGLFAQSGVYPDYGFNHRISVIVPPSQTVVMDIGQTISAYPAPQGVTIAYKQGGPILYTVSAQGNWILVWDFTSNDDGTPYAKAIYGLLAQKNMIWDGVPQTTVPEGQTVYPVTLSTQGQSQIDVSTLGIGGQSGKPYYEQPNYLGQTTPSNPSGNPTVQSVVPPPVSVNYVKYAGWGTVGFGAILIIMAFILLVI